jgi:hypothetical protein
MPRPRTPTEKAKATGAAKHDPARHAGRANPTTKPLGKPSSHLTGNAIVAWEAFKTEIPWLTESDRGLAETAARIRGRLLDGEDVGLTALALYRQMLKDMGGTPVDRSRIAAAPEGDDKADPAAAYFS